MAASMDATSRMPLRPVQPLLLAGALAGVLDILAAFAVSWPRVPPVRVLQYIASGVLGPAAFRGGGVTAGVGLALHFVIATGAAAAYYAASRHWPPLRRYPVACGLAYGVVVYLVMNAVVLPLSRVTVRGTSWTSVLVMIAIHMVCVGLPIALVISRGDRAGARLRRERQAAPTT